MRGSARAGSFLLLSLCAGALTSACGDGPTEPVPGTLELTLSTTGRHLDPDGYTVAIDGGAPTAVPANGTVVVADLSPEPHVLALAGADENCTLQETDPVTFSVTPGVPTQVTLHIICAFVNTLAYTEDGTLYVTRATTGAVSRPIGAASALSWSRDGGTLALLNGSETLLADANGGNLRVLYDWQGSLPQLSPILTGIVWSPDGTALLVEHHSIRLVYSIASLSTTPGVGVLWGTTGFSPSWSPDGRHVLFNRGFGVSLFSAEGVFERNVASGVDPAWSPDGARIAFSRMETEDTAIHTITPEGTDERDLSASASRVARDYWPDWSPDSRELAFVVRTSSGTFPPVGELWVMDAAGGNRRMLAAEVASIGRGVTWSPDGQRLALLLATQQLAVIERDGTGLTVVSASGRFVSSWGWRP